MKHHPSRDLNDMSEHALTRDVAFNRESMQDGEHISPFDNRAIQVGTDGIEVALVQGIDEAAFKRTLSAATRATIGIDITPTYEWVNCHDDAPHMHLTDADTRHITVGGHEVWQHYRKVDPLAAQEDWEEMMRGGLQTALESQTIVFAVKGVSRTCTHQLVRSRRAAFHQQSQRASSMGRWPECRMPESVWRQPLVRAVWFDALLMAHRAYQAAIDADVSYQDSRFILPEGTTNFIMCEYPVREFLNVYAYRGCSMFQWEIVHVMREMRRVLVEAHPWLEPHLKISCERTGPAVLGDGENNRVVAHHCTFQGWEQVEGQCDFPWALEDARTFRSTHHEIKRVAK